MSTVGEDTAVLAIGGVELEGFENNPVSISRTSPPTPPIPKQWYRIIESSGIESIPLVELDTGNLLCTVDYAGEVKDHIDKLEPSTESPFVIKC